MENIHRLLQLSPYRCYYRREDLHNAWRSKSRSAINGANTKGHAADRCSGRWWEKSAMGLDPILSSHSSCFLSRLALWFAMVRPWQRHYRVVRERQRGVFYIWTGCRISLPAKAWYGPDLSSTSSKFIRSGSSVCSRDGPSFLINLYSIPI
jgi:hypothetical protein